MIYGVTTFLTPYIMKAAVPCYSFFYKHAPAQLRDKMDRREQQVAQAEQAQAQNSDNPSQTRNQKSKIQKVLSHTVVTKRVVDLFIENMSAKDKENSEAKDE